MRADKLWARSPFRVLATKGELQGPPLPYRQTRRPRLQRPAEDRRESSYGLVARPHAAQGAVSSASLVAALMGIDPLPNSLHHLPQSQGSQTGGAGAGK